MPETMPGMDPERKSYKTCKFAELIRSRAKFGWSHEAIELLKYRLETMMETIIRRAEELHVIRNKARAMKDKRVVMNVEYSTIYDAIEELLNP